MAELLGKGFHAVTDLFEFGPIGAFQINTSGFAASERAIKRAVRNVKKARNVEIPEFTMENLLKEKHLLNIMLGVDKAASEAEMAEVQERRDFILRDDVLDKEEDFIEEVKATLNIVQEQIDFKLKETEASKLEQKEVKQLL